ncbi:MAG: T9SS type A sorting domain-containing protein [Chitinophagales bacterium]|nr:T9SS type A sorting domain-containing protein [Chitinophagales bacterium]
MLQKYLLCCFLFCSTLAFSQTVKVVGYLPYYRFSWINDIEFERLTHVNIAFANPDANGNLSVESVSITNAVDKAHAAGCEVFISLAGGYLTPQNEANWDNLALPANRPAFIQKIVQYVQDQDLDGVDLDLEWQYVKSWYSPFVLELKAALQAANIPLTVALPGNYRYPQISNAALAAFDWLNMMVYDLRGPWDPSNPGQHSPYDWAEDCIAYWKNQGMAAEKLTLGVPFYGYDFGVSPVESFNYRGIVNQDPANAYLDNTGMKWWNGIPTIQAKTELALAEVSGIMIWEIGQDAFGANSQYSLLRAIDEVVDAATSGTNNLTIKPLRIYPNPVQDRLYLDLGDQQIDFIQIMDMQGRVWQQGAALQQVGDLPPGMYVVEARGEQGVWVGRFVKR